MNEEIKEILDDLQNEDCYWIDCGRKNTSLTDDEAHLLLNYIFNLQNRIDKAIEYIEKNKIQNYDGYYIMLEGDCNKVIDILKESGE